MSTPSATIPNLYRLQDHPAHTMCWTFGIEGQPLFFHDASIDSGETTSKRQAASTAAGVSTYKAERSSLESTKMERERPPRSRFGRGRDHGRIQ
jgi:hypothetical protein